MNDRYWAIMLFALIVVLYAVVVVTCEGGEREAPRDAPPASVTVEPLQARGLAEAWASTAMRVEAVDDADVDAAVEAVVMEATHYGIHFNGRKLGCRGAGVYDSDNPLIVAVGPRLYDDVPCGTPIRICGSHGCNNDAMRVDSCPACRNRIDLSEAGMEAVCGRAVGVCIVSVVFGGTP